MPENKLEKLISLIFRTHRMFGERARDSERIDPFIVLRTEALRFILLSERPTMKGVARHLHITAPSATSLVGGLAKAGYVRRRKDASDRRTVLLDVTPKGKKMLDEAMKHVAARMKKTFSRLDMSDIDALGEILERLANSYEKDSKGI